MSKNDRDIKLKMQKSEEKMKTEIQNNIQPPDFEKSVLKSPIREVFRTSDLTKSKSDAKLYA